jgi:anti-sigma factor RsiW
VSFSLSPLRSPPDCADALDDLLVAVSEGKLTPDEANLVSAIVAKRAELFASVELAAEIEALKSQLAAIVGRPPPPTPIRRPFAIT